MGDRKPSPKFIEARDTLPAKLRPIYDQMVEEYAFHALIHYGRGWVAYKVIAALVKDGWQPQEAEKLFPPRP